jgi:predicted O-methyltransferase YrrM
MELKTNDYKFTKPWFKSMEKSWDGLFKWYIEEQKNEIKSVLEIGCFEGMASTYMCENWLKDGTHYHIIDTFGGSENETGHQDLIKQINDGDDFIYNNFKHNTSFFPNIGWKVERETSQHMLPLLEREGYMFDFIYVDASHQADDTFVDAYWSHKMLKPNGIIIMDDFGWKEEGRDKPIDSPEFGIRAFLTLYQDEYALLAQGYQIALLKKPEATIIKGNVK